MDEQSELSFAEGPAPDVPLEHPLEDLLEAIAARWELPIGRRVRVTLRDSALPDVVGKLELMRAPELPLDPREVLALRVGGLSFTAREIASWSLVE